MQPDTLFTHCLYIRSRALLKLAALVFLWIAVPMTDFGQRYTCFESTEHHGVA